MNTGKRQLQHSPSEKPLQNNSKKFQNMSAGDTFTWEGLQTMLNATLEKKLEDVVKKQDFEVIKIELDDVKAENLKLRKEIKQLTSKIELIDRKTRSSNVVVNGLKSTNIQSANTEFSKLCNEVLDMNVNVTNTTIIGKNAVLFGLESHAAVQNVLATKQKLRGRSVFIQRDYTSHEQHTRYNLRHLSKTIKSKNSSINIKLGEFCIYISNKKFTWKNDNIIAFSYEDAEFLKDLLRKCKYNYNIVINEKPTNSISNFQQ